MSISDLPDGLVFGKSAIEKMITAPAMGEPPLIQDFQDLNLQLQPNGFDLTLKTVAAFKDAGQAALSNAQRVLSETEELPFDSFGWLNLATGCYKIVYNEWVNIPAGVIALANPRSSLLRCGVTVETAVWDAGYQGRSESMLVVHNPHGFRVRKDARIIQLLFLRTVAHDPDTELYDGKYLFENR